MLGNDDEDGCRDSDSSQTDTILYVGLLLLLVSMASMSSQRIRVHLYVMQTVSQIYLTFCLTYIIIFLLNARKIIVMYR